jgi:hypothetical protein
LNICMDFAFPTGVPPLENSWFSTFYILIHS